MIAWYWYMVLCADGTLYTGVTTDPDRRLRQHNSGKGAKYTRPSGRRPVEMVFTQEAESKVAAYKLEYANKQMPRSMKLWLLSDINKKKAEEKLLAVRNEPTTQKKINAKI